MNFKQRQKLYQLFALGQQVGKKESGRTNITYEELREIAAEEFNKRDRLISELINLSNS